jgi:hypothetical protein
MVFRRILVIVGVATVVAIVGPCEMAGATASGPRPVIGIAKGTTSVNLDTGAGNTVNQGYLLGVGLFTARSTSTFAYTSATTFQSTGSGVIDAQNGNELFFTNTGTGTVTGSAVTGRTVDTITGGTGRFAGASGQLIITARGSSGSTVGSTETFTTFGVWLGTISYSTVDLADLSGSFSGALSVAAGNGCSLLDGTFDATYPGSSAVGSVTLQVNGCIPLALPPTPAPFSGTFTLNTTVGTLTGSAAGQINNVNVPPNGVYPSTATLTLTATSGTGEFAGTTGTLNANLQWPEPGSLSFTGTIAPA